MQRSLIILLALLITASCKPAVQAPAETAPADAKHYTLTGKVVSVDRAAKKAKIDHGDIPGYMEAMTMDFPIKEDWVWDELTPGSEIHADLVVAKDGFWLEKIGIVAAPNANQPAPPVDPSFAQIGKPAPDFSLTNQDGKKISLKDFRGKALAITFIYRECPLPDYCIKMSKNFSDLAIQLQNDAENKDKIRLLSISFDPARDTPEKLRQYGIGYLGNDPNASFNIWQLAVGGDKEVRSIADFFGLRYETDANDKTQINHSLRTIVISPEGKITKIYAGNEWTPGDLLKELKASMQPSA